MDRYARDATDEYMDIEYPEIQGFINPSNSSCYIDSLIIAMFGPMITHASNLTDEQAKQSFNNGAAQHPNNFYNIFYKTNIESRGPFDPMGPFGQVCSKNEKRDLAIRINIQNIIRNDLESLSRGERFECSRLRKELGKSCGQDLGKEDFSEGQQYPHDLFYRLMQVFAYEPLTTREKVIYAFTNSAKESIKETCINTRESNTGNLLSANIPVMYNSFPQSMQKENSLIFYWNPPAYERMLDEKTGTWRNIENPLQTTSCRGAGAGFRYNLKGTFILFERADTLVIDINRGDPVNKALFEKPVGVPSEITLDIAPPNQRPEKREYKLFSAIIHEGRSANAAHYTTLLNVPPTNFEDSKKYTWYLYDDLAEEPYEILSDEKANDLLSRRAVMVFYFPYDQGQEDVILDLTEPKVNVKKLKTNQKEESVPLRESEKNRMKNLYMELINMGFDIDSAERMTIKVVEAFPKFESLEIDLQNAFNL